MRAGPPNLHWLTWARAEQPPQLLHWLNLAPAGSLTPCGAFSLQPNFPRSPRGNADAGGSSQDQSPIGRGVTQAQDALALMLRRSAADLPHSIEEGAEPTATLNGYVDPLVVVIPFERVPAAKVA